jgi:hypothetical protein
MEVIIVNARAWIMVVLGLWFVASAYLSLGVHGQELSNVFVGLVVAVVGFSMMHGRSMMIGWLAGWFGIWMIVSAFIPTLVEGNGLQINNVVFGLLIALTGFEATRKGKEAL